MLFTVLGTMQWIVGLGLTYGVVTEVVVPAVGALTGM